MWWEKDGGDVEREKDKIWTVAYSREFCSNLDEYTMLGVSVSILSRINQGGVCEISFGI